MADFTVMTSEQNKPVKLVHPGELNSMKQQHAQDTDQYINDLLKFPNVETDSKMSWLPTPEYPGDKTKYYPITTRNLQRKI